MTPPAKKKKSLGKKATNRAVKKAAPKKSIAKKADAAGHGVTLVERIVTAPQLAEPKAARDKVAQWLAGLPLGEAKPFTALLAANENLTTLLASLAESSPFLWELASAEPARLLRLLNANPDKHLAQLLAENGRAVATTDDEDKAMRLLRRMKAEAALLIALADIGGVWPVMRAARALTDLADTAVDSAVRFILAEAARDGRLAPKDKAQPQIGSGYIVLAMGKMGAYELNYSSDIDLIVFYDPEAEAVPEGAEPAPLFVKLTQRLVKLLQQRTGDGYVFRTDLRLRPDPSSTAIAISVAAALSYYESTGQNWERAAMIKARACAGDIAAAEAILNELSPFIWRKYLDFVSLADVHAMKRQINAYRGHGQIAVEGHNIKLGRGGIREVEFFAQTQQLIAGGRNPHLRDRDTITTLAKLCEDRWIDETTRDDMKAAYEFLRTVEHRLQMVNDEQTQSLPAERDGLERFARFLGYAGRDEFAGVLVGHLDKVQRHYARLFEKGQSPDYSALVFPAEADDRKTLDRLAELGFRSPLEASAVVRHWLAGEHRSLKGEVARSHLEALLPVLMEQIGRTDNPNASLVLFDHFLANLFGAARLLSLLRQKPELIALTTLVLGIAPRLADTLARNPQVMDALVDPSFFGAMPDDAELMRRLDAELAQSRYDEDLLERIRMFGLEYMFLTGVRILSGTVTARQAGEAFARLAGAVIRAVHHGVAGNFAATYGHIRGEQTAV
ncbi:MAG: bifunctional [glutamine synthetase] adenylyltransferase/[glutamine synthetase]-adenylyl-L-tyrosine phosphorylase, partial [Pseudolabrys sp.]